MVKFDKGEQKNSVFLFEPSSSSFLAKNQANGDSQPVINITLPGADTCVCVRELSVEKFLNIKKEKGK